MIMVYIGSMDPKTMAMYNVLRREQHIHDIHSSKAYPHAVGRIYAPCKEDHGLCSTKLLRELYMPIPNGIISPSTAPQ